MTSQFDLTRFHDFIICKSVFLPCFLTREFQISLNIHSFVIDIKIFSCLRLRIKWPMLLTTYLFQPWLLATSFLDFTLSLFHQKAKMSVNLNIFIKRGVFSIKWLLYFGCRKYQFHLWPLVTQKHLHSFAKKAFCGKNSRMLAWPLFSQITLLKGHVNVPP